MERSSFTKRIPVNAASEKIYAAWTVPAEIERWFLSRADYVKTDSTRRAANEAVQKGDGYTWRWCGFPDGAPESGTILEANGTDHFSFSFAGDCVVDVSIRDEDDERVVELVQHSIPPENDLEILVGCGEGWTFYLANLKSYLEGGIDLRNRNENITSVINS